MANWIVVVDDEALSLTNARFLLGSEDLRVSCLRSGRDLLRFMEKNTPDLILLDVMMPEMDGFETYDALRRFEEQHSRTQVPVIFLSGEDDSLIEQRGLKIGASDFIHKPFNKDILIRRIHNTIQNSKTLESLAEEAATDGLTGFLNKTGGTAIIAKQCRDGTGALTVMDLDSFKLVNDLFGHGMGDRVLQAFADILRHNTREADVVSRIGGDEFMAFFSGMTDPSAVAALTGRLNRQLAEEAVRLLGADHGIPLGISLGAVMIPEHGRDYDALFAMADGALYAVKQNGKHGYAIHDRSEAAGKQRRDDLEAELDRITRIMEERTDRRGALLLDRESFSVVYRFLMRFRKDNGGSCVKLLFALSPCEDCTGARLAEDRVETQLTETTLADSRLIKTRLTESQLVEASAQFGLTLQKTVRNSDMMMQNRSNQFFMLLNDLTGPQTEAVIGRILASWNRTEYASGTHVRYTYEVLEFLQEEAPET